jgi:dihydrofolate reductase
MGRKTYESAGKPHGDGIRRIIMSRGDPFPHVNEALLVGGSQINAVFLKKKLINEIYLTIEPKIFGIGLPLAQGTLDDVHLELQNCTRLNAQGTLLLYYHVK